MTLRLCDGETRRQEDGKTPDTVVHPLETHDFPINVLLSEEQIALRVRELALRISGDYAGKDLVIIGVLRGAFVFLADLIKHISIPIVVDFTRISSYGDATISSGVVKVFDRPRENVMGRHVLLVEDIVDTGLTLTKSGVIDDLLEAGAESVEICALLNKPSRRLVSVSLKYVGFDIPDKFVIGYGLDYQGMFRNLPYVGYREDV
jgi:hypoxanthine phosphoribosyltransferase